MAELPHNLETGETVIIRNVTDSSSTGIAYNGTYDITVVDNFTFTYTTTNTPGTFTNDTSVRSINSPRFERNDLKSNLFVYRNEIIREYEEDNQTGIYHLYTLNANNQIQQEFTNLKYGQDVTNLYPQLDRDNVNANPNSSTTYALRSPIGKVATDDLKKSITKESANLLLTSLGIGRKVSTVAGSTITFERDHELAGIVTYSTLDGGTGHTDGTYYNVCLLYTSDAADE